MDGRYNRCRALFLEIQHIADHAQLALQRGDEKAAKTDLREITVRVNQLPTAFPVPPAFAKNGASQHLLQTASPPSSSSSPSPVS